VLLAPQIKEHDFAKLFQKSNFFLILVVRTHLSVTG